MSKCKVELEACQAELAVLRVREARCQDLLKEALGLIEHLEPLAKSYLSEPRPDVRHLAQTWKGRHEAGMSFYDWGVLAQHAQAYREVFRDTKTGQLASWQDAWIFCRQLFGEDKVPSTAVAFRKGIQRYIDRVQEAEE